MLRYFARQGSIVVALLLVSAGVALAAGGGGKSPSSSSSISLALMAAATTSGLTGPSYGQAVSFNVSTTATSQPFVHLQCSRGSTLVYEGWKSWPAGSNGVESFTLGGTTAWQSGAATCTAYLENWDSYSKNGKVTVLASTNFNVGA